MIRPVHAPSTFPQTCLVDPQPPVGPPDPDPMASLLGSIILTSDPETCEPLATAQYCDAPGSRLYYHNATSAHDVPSQGKICINTRDNEIPEDVIAANKTAHAAIAKYLRQHGIASAPWLYYKLINVQYFPYDKEITPGRRTARSTPAHRPSRRPTHRPQPTTKRTSSSRPIARSSCSRAACRPRRPRPWSRGGTRTARRTRTPVTMATSTTWVAAWAATVARPRTGDIAR